MVRSLGGHCGTQHGIFLMQGLSGRKQCFNMHLNRSSFFFQCFSIAAKRSFTDKVSLPPISFAIIC